MSQFLRHQLNGTKGIELVNFNWTQSTITKTTVFIRNYLDQFGLWMCLCHVGGVGGELP